MSKPYTKKEIIYYINNDDNDNDKAIRTLRADLYETYDNVMITPNGLYESRIICTND